MDQDIGWWEDLGLSGVQDVAIVFVSWDGAELAFEIAVNTTAIQTDAEIAAIGNLLHDPSEEQVMLFVSVLYPFLIPTALRVRVDIAFYHKDENEQHPARESKATGDRLPNADRRN